MKKALSRTLSLLLCLTMLFSVLAIGGFATEAKGGTLSSVYASYAAQGHTNDPLTDSTFAVTGDSVRISVLTTTDMHGRAYDWNSYTNSALTNNLLQAAELIAARRAAADDSIVVDNGDILQGSALSSFNNTQEAGKNSPIAIALRGIGYDLFNLGNHEFNYSPEVQWNYYNALSSTDPALPGEPVDVVCANIVEKSTQESVFAPYKLFPYRFADGTEFTIGVISFENMNNANWDVASHYEGCDFAHADNTDMSYVYEYETYWKQELASKCDYVIVMQHTGEGSTTNYSQENQGAWFVSHTKGVDLLITGHSHGAKATTIANAEGTEIPVINAGGSNVGELTITLTNNAGEVQVSCGAPTLYAFSTASKPTNADGPTYQSPTSTDYNDLKALLKGAFDKADAFVNTTIGTVSGKWDDVTSYHYAQGDSYDVVHKAQIWAATTSYGLDATKNHVVSITSPVASGSFSFGQLLSGGQSLTNVSLRDCYSLYKYDNNTLFMIKMTGAKLMNWMQRTANTFRVNASSGKISGGGFGTDQFYGINYTVYLGNEAGKRVTDVTYADGTPVKPTDEIYVCLSSYRLSATEGSDSYGWFASTGITSNSPEVVWDATISDEFNTVGGSVPLIVGEYIKSLTAKGRHVTPGRETYWQISTEEDPWTEIRTFETTDIHGYLMDTSSGSPDTFQYRMAYLAKVFSDARTSGNYDDVLLLDGGDIYQGTPVSNLLYGNALRAALDEMDYDAVCLGNHEFDWNVTTYAADVDGTIPAYEIGSYKGDSDIPVLAYNIFDTGTTNRAGFVKDYVILDKAGLKVAVIGYVPDYSGDIMAAKINPYDIDQSIDNLKTKIAAVNEAEKPDVTVVLAHASPKSLANALNAEDVDLVLGGHSHSASYGTADNGIAYIQGNCQAQGYASATIKVNKDTGAVMVAEPAYTSITGNKADLYDTEGNEKLDPTVLDISKLSWDAVKDDMGEVLGTVDQSITRRVKIENSTNTIAGNWTAGLMLAATKELNTVAAFCNSGGIRCDLLVPEGATTRDITVGDIYTISPFGNRIFTYEVTGAELAQQILNGFKNANYGDQFSGMKATYTREESVNAETGKTSYTYQVVSITLDDGTVVDIKDTEKTYVVCVNEYCATLAGSVFENKTPIQDVNEAPIDNLSMIAALRAEGKANGGKLALDLTPRCTPYSVPVVDPCDRFTDVDTNKWYHEAVRFVLENDLMRGVSDNRFAPNDTMTRAMMVTVLYRIAGEPEVTTGSGFNDVPAGKWYTNAVAWAKENNIVTGVTQDSFAPDDPITREQVATILWRYLKSPESKADMTVFSDAESISGYAKDAMAWAVETGILIGDYGRLKPTEYATRAEFATMIMRFALSIRE